MSVLSAYRQLLRSGYRAVGGRFPQTKVVKVYLRQKFESSEPVDPETLDNTVKFMQAAADWPGLERRCVQTLVHNEHSRYERRRYFARAQGQKREMQLQLQFNDDVVDKTKAGLNRTMNLCL